MYFISLILTLLKVLLKLICATFTTLNSPSGISIASISFAQHISEILCEACTISAAWIYITCNHIIANLCDNVILEMSRFQEHNNFVDLTKTINRSLQRCVLLQQATSLLKNRFGLILMINCCYIVMILISSPVYLVQSNFWYPYYITWDCVNILEPLIRLIFICQSSDAIHVSVSSMRFNIGFP